MTTDNIPALKVEPNDDGTLTLEQDWLGNVDRVAIHPMHVRLLAEHTGLLAKSNSEKSAAELQRENDRLKRNMLRLREHALDLQKDFVQNADWDHADLTHEMSNINALVNLMDMAVDDFADDYEAHEPSRRSERSSSAPPAVVTNDHRPKPSPKASGKPGQLALEV